MSPLSLVHIIRGAIATAAVVLLWLKSTADSLAASPSPGTIPPVDPRGGGEPPGFTGGPLEVLLLVVLLGVVASVITVLVVRLTGAGGDT